MKTQLYRNIRTYGDETNKFLVFHISDENVLPDLEKFTGGHFKEVNGSRRIVNAKGESTFSIGDYVVYITSSSPYSKVRLEIDKVRHLVPKDSFMFCKPDEFLRNFEEIIHE